MKRYSDVSLEALNILLIAGLMNQVEEGTDLEDKFAFVEWKPLRRMIVMHGLSGFVRDGITFLQKESLPVPPKKFIIEIGISAMKGEKQFLRQWQAAVNLAKEWNEAGLKTNVIKGFSIAALYPHPKSRQSSDLDSFLIYQDATKNDNGISAPEVGNQVVEKAGIEVDRSVHLHSIFEYMGLHVENHLSLTETRGSERAQAFENLLRKILIEEGTKQIKSSDMWAPKMMFNALYLTHHAQKHLLREQMSLKQVIDWAMILRRIAKNTEPFDWESFWGYCKEYGMLKFAQTMSGLAVSLCHVPCPEGLPRNHEEENILLHFIIDEDLACEETGPSWWRRIKLIRRIISYREKYKHFADHSVWKEIRQLVKGKFE